MIVKGQFEPNEYTQHGVAASSYPKQSSTHAFNRAWLQKTYFHAQHIAIKSNRALQVTDANVVFEDPFNRSHSAGAEAADSCRVAGFPLAP
jgi:hypothetical protein